MDSQSSAAAEELIAHSPSLGVPGQTSWTLICTPPPPPKHPQSCHVCGNLDHVVLFPVELETLVKSSRAGCISCGMLCTVLEPYRRTHFKTNEAKRPVRIRWNVKNLLLDLPFPFRRTEGNDPDTYLKLHICASEGVLE